MVNERNVPQTYDELMQAFLDAMELRANSLKDPTIASRIAALLKKLSEIEECIRKIGDSLTEEQRRNAIEALDAFRPRKA